VASRKKKASKSQATALETKKILEYKIVELSAVDESTLQSTLNEWVPKGYRFDGMQFAMRESSRRPSMAFVFFTRETSAEPTEYRTQSDAHSHLNRLSSGDKNTNESQPLSAWERLEKMAQED
jgi:hypothetical protein